MSPWVPTLSFRPATRCSSSTEAATSTTATATSASGEELVPLDIPSDAGYAVHRGWLFVTPRSDWATGGRTYPTGSLLAVGVDDFLAGGRDLAVLFEPGEGNALAEYSLTRNHVLINVLDNVRNRIDVATPGFERLDR